jgi:hypothetical protein
MFRSVSKQGGMDGCNGLRNSLHATACPFEADTKLSGSALVIMLLLSTAQGLGRQTEGWSWE